MDAASCSPGSLCRRPLEIVTACRAADLPTLRLTAEFLARHVPFKRLWVITHRSNARRFSRTLGGLAEILDENEVVPEMTLEQLQLLPLPEFPRGAGWYFQQYLKLAFAFRNQEDDYYLIWDADTIPLRPLEFFDAQGRMLFATSAEFHPPYFDTYRKILGTEPHREFSFISQHIIVRKSIARQMLKQIEQHCPGDQNWAWKITHNLAGAGSNRFSEYETYGHYLKNAYPELAAFRQLPWLREGTQHLSLRPSRAQLESLGRDYCFAAFEARHGRLRRAVRFFRKHMHW